MRAICKSLVRHREKEEENWISPFQSNKSRCAKPYAVLRCRGRAAGPRADKTEKFPNDLFSKWAELGLLDVRYLEADGGTDFDKVTDYIICEGAAEVQCNIIVRDLKG